MKLSIFTTITDPLKRQDPYLEALDCYTDLADEVIVIDGSYRAPGGFTNHDSTGFWDSLPDEEKYKKIKRISHFWPEEFSFDFIGKQFQFGYVVCSGDWVIHADIDYIFHEGDIKAIRRSLEMAGDAPGATFLKKQFLKADRFNIKNRLVIAVNKGVYGDRIKFNGGGDLCQPTLDGVLLDESNTTPISIPFWNYDFTFKTQEIVKHDVHRMAKAWVRVFDKDAMGAESEEVALARFKVMQEGRYSGRSWEKIDIEDHPKYIKESIKNLTPEQFGHSLWGFAKD